MAIALRTKQIKDGAGVIFLQRVVDLSGAGQGPDAPVMYFGADDGQSAVGIEALFASIADGPDFAASGVTPVTVDFTAAGSSGVFTPKAGRDSILQITGAGAADLQIEIRIDGTNWLPIKASDGDTQLFRIAYAGVPFATLVPPLPVAGAALRVTDLTHGAGAVSVLLKQ